MKKTKFMIGALVLSMGLLGTGYAYWTDTISVGASVNTGHLSVGFTDVAIKGAPQRHDKDGIGKPGGTTGIDNEHLTATTVSAGLSKDGRTAIFNLNDLCPGYKATYTATVQNTGTMAALLEEINFDTTSLGALKDHLAVKVSVKNNTNWVQIPWTALGGETSCPVMIGDEEFMLINDATIMINKWIKENCETQLQDASLYVNPKDAMEIKLEVAMITDADNDTTQNVKDSQFGVTTKWTQYNKGMKNSVEKVK